MASDNKIFTHRAIRPSVRQRHFGEWKQPDNPALAKSVGPGAFAP
ncbi:hypothetical protein [Paenibacillus polymyxa]|nr:hypothetical protein [Paenibacillus polymyxa]MDN4088534.1 hypothetical protein [Paenibacillus polymyxa]